MAKVKLKEIAHARSGDKGNTVNIAVFANHKDYYPLLVEQMTVARMTAFFKGLVLGEINRYELPNIEALNFVCYEALDGGGSSSMRIDHLGKCFGSNILRFEIEVPDSFNVK
ncbi:hypothetical protein JOC94_000460 [Bacillus thermophilus]|uniref:AtuA-like ferredoxin-fold domain-containing protein n=1 Tax=Siminovitchia thermophila TaxID=1245522 RepID=A0ABS2R1I5_9BACI|nr:hypothetical protein [Siminovitchia thermophila]MBM7713492.1 hypothetical protein [Siminovitchia thermophila]